MSERSAVDLHLHSTASDGVLDPSALVAHVADCGVRLMALTDHDTVAGVATAAAAARARSITFVAGVELSAAWRGKPVHILGLAIDPDSLALAEGLAAQRSRRETRAERIAAKLDAAGAPGREVLGRVRAGANLPTRTHFARALAELGLAADVPAAFDRWLGRGRRAYVPGEWPDLAEAVRWIAAAGGKAVIAHPMRYALSAGKRRELCADFATVGGDGIEVVTGGGGRADREQATSLAVRFRLAGSVGSDFHDPSLPWHMPGRLAKLPGSVSPVWSGPPFPASERLAEPA
jgi:3',5'-nucleoside bisphosphate phosphatase